MFVELVVLNMGAGAPRERAWLCTSIWYFGALATHQHREGGPPRTLARIGQSDVAETLLPISMVAKVRSHKLTAISSGRLRSGRGCMVSSEGLDGVVSSLYVADDGRFWPQLVQTVASARTGCWH